jgi:2',3'-cyclic-nucleotide 2'-phosphodiesterase (5'-nucleotidase family)
MKVLKALVASVAASAVCFVAAQAGSDANLPAQAAADVLRSAAKADIAFLPSGMLRDTPVQRDNLASLLQFPTDELAVVGLKGSQVKAALERSVALHPSPSSSFLQLSGLEVTFSKSADPDRRVVSVTVGQNRLDESKTYAVAMPSTLARGGLGYFRCWERSAISRTLTGVTLESLLKGKPYTDTKPRWTALP